MNPLAFDQLSAEAHGAYVALVLAHPAPAPIAAAAAAELAHAGLCRATAAGFALSDRGIALLSAQRSRTSRRRYADQLRGQAKAVADSIPEEAPIPEPANYPTRPNYAPPPLAPRQGVRRAS